MKKRKRASEREREREKMSQQERERKREVEKYSERILIIWNSMIDFKDGVKIIFGGFTGAHKHYLSSWHIDILLDCCEEVFLK